jgi:hypothetical protein
MILNCSRSEPMMTRHPSLFRCLIHPALLGALVALDLTALAAPVLIVRLIVLVIHDA